MLLHLGDSVNSDKAKRMQPLLDKGRHHQIAISVIICYTVVQHQAPVAQWIERLTSNQQAAGSSPAGRAKSHPLTKSTLKRVDFGSVVGSHLRLRPAVHLPGGKGQKHFGQSETESHLR